MTDKSWLISQELIHYLRGINAPEHPLLAQLRAETHQHRKGRMHIAPEQVQLLVWLAQLIQAKKYLEIGIFTGYSSTAMAMVLPEDGHITACDISVTYTNTAQHYWRLAQVENKITLHLQPALITLNTLLEQGKQEYYDMALIDADKPPTPDYFEYCLKLIRPNGIIAIDNLLLNGRVAQQINDHNPPSIDIIRKFNQKLQQDKRVHTITLPIGDGLTIIIKK